MTMTNATDGMLQARTEARKRFGDDCYLQAVDGMLQARPLHGLTWHDVARVGPAVPMPTYAEGASVPTCDMVRDCGDPVTHIDNKGFIYCTTHGIARRSWKPCRKLRAHEIRRLERGEQVTKY